MRIGFDPSALHFDADRIQAKSVDIRRAAGRHQNNISIEGDSVTALDGFKGDLTFFAFLGHAGDFGVHLEGKALLLQRALELFGDTAVHTAQNGAKIFNHGDIGSKAGPD